MRRVLILGCNEIAKRLVLALCADRSYASGIALASKNREDCDEIRNLAAQRGMRVTTSAINLDNVEGAVMMIKIIAPELVVNLLPPDKTLAAMDLASLAGADYIDGRLCGVPALPTPVSLLAEQFKKFGSFQHLKRTAVCGAGVNPAVMTMIAKLAASRDFTDISKIGICYIPGEAPEAGKDKADEAGNKEPSKDEAAPDKKDEDNTISKDGEDKDKAAAETNAKADDNADARKPEEADDVDDGAVVDEVLYSEDIKKPSAGRGNDGSTDAVVYIEDGKAKTAEKFTRESRTSEGKRVYMVSDSIITNFLKEMPEIPAAEYYTIGDRQGVRIPPADKIELLRSLGLLSDKPVRVGTVSIAPIDLVAAVLPKQQTNQIKQKEQKDIEYKGIASYEIHITGTKNGKEVTRLYRISGDNDEIRRKYGISAPEYLDGSVLIAGVKLMCDDKWKKNGVFTPAAFDSELFYSAIQKEGLNIEEKNSIPLRGLRPGPTAEDLT